MDEEAEQQIIWLDEEAQEADRVWVCLECSFATPDDPSEALFEDLCFLCGSRMVSKRSIEAAQTEEGATFLSTQSKLIEF